MPIELVKDRRTFDEIRENWQSVYREDTESQWFLSWQWLSQLFDRRDEPISILAYKTDSTDNAYSAFFPIRQQVRLSRSCSEISTVYRLPGNYWADYTGFICVPSAQNDAISAFARYFIVKPWRKLYLENMLISEQRLSLLLQAFSESNYSIKRKQFGGSKAGPDLSYAPEIKLPTTFESYLTHQLSSNTRQRIRRYRRKLDADNTFSIRMTNPDSIDEDLDSFERLWTNRWSDEKGAKVGKLAQRYAEILEQALEAGDMMMHVMTHHDRPIGMVACYLDHEKTHCLFFVAARDTTVRSMPIGLLLHAQAIELVINKGFTCYDFLRGDEAYKYSLGAKDKRVSTVIVTAKTGGTCIDTTQKYFVEHAISKLHKYQHQADARAVEKIYKQLLDLWPKSTGLLKHYDSWTQNKKNADATQA